MHRSNSLLATAFLSTWLACFSPAAQALSSQAATEQVQAQLVASANAVRPGDQIVLGVQQRIIPHWHTYWLNPGDSGIATTIAWSLPAGASAGDIQWPVPSRFKLGPITNLGYEKEVTLLSSVSVPDDAKAGDTFPIQAKVNWLVCQEVCIPQEVQLDLVLPILKKGATLGPGSPLIDQAKARLPVESPWPVQVEQRADKLALTITSPELQAAKAKDIWFYPAKWGQVVHNAEQTLRQEGEALVLDLQPGEDPVAPGGTLSGVLVVTEGGGNGAVVKGFNVEASVKPGAVTTPGSAPVNIGLAAALGLALLGGLILNLMPCVFPVLSIKALALLSHAEQTPSQRRLHGLVYTLGVLASFALLAGLLIALKAGGAQVGWGFQFQSPLFVLAVAYLMFAVGLSLSGVFSIGGSVAGVGSSLAERSGYSGSFFTGVLATIVATPCTAPFMGGAVGYALAQPAGVLLAVFLSLGLGLALPYLALSTWPALQRALPRPGLWMERVKQGFAFPMYATAAWLVWVLGQQAGINSVAIALAGMVAIAFAAWLYESFRHGRGLPRLAGLGVASLALLVAVMGGYVGINASSANTASSTPQAGDAAEHWEPYTAQRLQDLRAKGEPVFVNLTAAWCITCLVNERVALSESSIKNAFKDAGITYLKGDWTNQDPQITKMLAQFGRSGVPLYAFYPKGVDAAPVVLPQLLTPEVVLAALKAAAVP